MITVSSVLAEEEVQTNVEQYTIQDGGENIKEVAEYLKKRQEKLEELAKKRKPESALRRFEIQFFSSGAMAYLTSWMATRIFSALTISQSSDLPDIYWMFILTNSVGIATYISVKDYYEVKAIRSKEIDELSHNYRNQQFYKLNLISTRF